MRNTTKESQEIKMEYIKSPQFIIEFLELIEQPLQKERVQKLNEFLQNERIERHRKAWRKVILG
jgi:hypothetical protein